MPDKHDNSEPETLPNTEPQAPRSISVESVDKDSRPAPFNEGGEPNGPTGGCSSL